VAALSDSTFPSAMALDVPQCFFFHVATHIVGGRDVCSWWNFFSLSLLLLKL